MVMVNFISVGLLITINSIDMTYYGIPSLIGKHSEDKSRYFSTEFTVQWYASIGPAICMALTFLIFTPHMSNGSFHVLKAMLRWYD